MFIIKLSLSSINPSKKFQPVKIHRLFAFIKYVFVL